MTLTARERLLPFFEAHRGAHSFHAFAPICVWSDIFDLHYKISGERLLIFAEEDGDCFLICPPLGTGDVLRPAEDALAMMRQLAPRGASPRIQDADDDSARRLIEGLVSAGASARRTSNTSIRAQNSPTCAATGTRRSASSATGSSMT